MGYNKIYKQNLKVWGENPSKLLQIILDKLPKNGYFLDLGCGQGRDSLFMSKQGFNVTSIDASETAINQLQKTIQENDLQNIEAIKTSIIEFEIENDKFDIISAFNSLHFLPKEKSLILIEKIKKNIKPNGFVIISAFTTEEPTCGKNDKPRTFFDPKELKNLFSSFSIIRYFEGLVQDSGHVGAPEPHQHGVVRIIAQKK